VTAVQRYAAAFALLGFSTRLSDLHDLDMAEYEALSTIPAQRGAARHAKPATS
jgi:hypothetical protein